MLLALDIGNTNVVAGLFAGDEIRAEMRVATDRDRTADEWHVLWDSLLRIRGFGIGNVTGACIASVVPGLIAPFEVWLAEARVPTVTCRSGDDLGVGVDIDNPAEAGIDRVLNCLAAKHRHGAPAIVVDMGTATTFDVLSREGNYIGGAIAPGMGAATVEYIAIAGVMAGCYPEYLPVLIAAAEAVGTKAFHLQAIQSTTNPAAVWLIVNGPIAKWLEIGRAHV